ncbi:phosphoribosyltransferase [Streptomyces sp. HUAS TT20]|uniref:phosphoribosyltransferase n=1 Tax=Streptomyces sp. HUAS TT20 TaxID=3447509 RepID=UPI003985AFF2
MRFEDRTDAARRPARRLEYLRRQDVVALGQPRDGVPVAFEVARELHAPLHVLVVRKLGVPWQPEPAFDAVGGNGVRLLKDDVIELTRLGPARQRTVERTQRAALERLVARYWRNRSPVPVARRTGRGGGRRAGHRRHRRGRVPGRAWSGRGPDRACRAGRTGADADPSAPGGRPAGLSAAPRFFGSVGSWYHDFAQVGAAEVTDLLARAARPARPSASPSAADPPPANREIEVPPRGAFGWPHGSTARRGTARRGVRARQRQQQPQARNRESTFGPHRRRAGPDRRPR